MKSRFWVLIVAVANLPLQASFASGGESMGGSGGGSMGMDMPLPTASPEEMAKSAYNSGIRYLDKVKGYEADAVKAGDNEKKKKSALDDARKGYQRALASFKSAVKSKPDMYQAWNYVGFCSRHLGDYDAALQAYGNALQLNPNYMEAIEYRGEAYLGLNRIEDAKAAYMTLFRDARDLSGELAIAMQHWLDARRQDPKGVSAADLDDFSKWLTERTQIAQLTPSLAPALAAAREWRSSTAQ